MSFCLLHFKKRGTFKKFMRAEFKSMFRALAWAEITKASRMKTCLGVSVNHITKSMLGSLGRFMTSLK